MGTCFLFLTAATSCKKTPDYAKVLHNPTLYSKTVHELNALVMGNNFTPVVASRNYAYAAVAGYEAIAAGNPTKYRSLVGLLNGLKAVPAAPANVDFEYAALLAYCKVGEAVTFPKGSMKAYTDSLHNLAMDHGMPEDMVKNTELYADTLSKAIIGWSKKDNYLKTRALSKFNVIPDSPGRWVPTPPMYGDAVEPNWRDIRPMVMSDAKKYDVVPPPTFNITDKNSRYYKEVIYIKNAGDSLNAEQEHIADFWDDNPGRLNVTGHTQYITKKFSPPGHWLSITGIAAGNAKADFATTVYAYAETSIALFDAFIECWAAKYKYETARPETVINQYIDKEWRPHLQTPPFPEYTCGHCTISAAAAETLTSVFGDNVAYKDTSELEFGIRSRSFKSFRQAADETSWSRFYGGIHFRNSTIVSSGYGKTVGDSVVARLQILKK
ncbi:phosphoesterase PA-phosphatase [Mucilaginibacter pedocola]|uniref:Phosphoesterase PA-phosphatase n=1 Tax=Mucilaginibacter pedocola TaxID=1792845 RepID=A0A1S9PJT0_9SPHI|nr:phosphoesterase PA-phosphatase [Mucilaginibacter pedocola]